MKDLSADPRGEKVVVVIDQPGPMKTYFGHLLVYDASVTDESRHEVETFLANNLKRKVFEPSNSVPRSPNAEIIRE